MVVHQPQPSAEKFVLVLQGGGALGAYQGGAYCTLSNAGYSPDWTCGISIGAINAAIIAGNKPENRASQLRRFWDLVSSRITEAPILTDETSRRIFNEWSAALTAATGAPGFFDPRYPPAILMPRGSRHALSFYDTSALRSTLEELVDFDILNSGRMRLSVGAVEIRTGNFRFFDTAKERVGPEHIMASGALPPGLPPILIGGEPYWDAGIVSNTPLQYVLECGPRFDMCVFQIDLFSARGPLPNTLFDVYEREKEIRYSSRTRLNTDVFRELQTIRRAIKRLDGVLPDEFRDLPDWQLLAPKGCDAAVTIVHLIHRRASYWSQTTDYDFSRFTTNEHWQAGIDDVKRTLEHPAWRTRQRPTEGVAVLDLTRDIEPMLSQARQPEPEDASRRAGSLASGASKTREA